jgi:hypothetical protein
MFITGLHTGYNTPRRRLYKMGLIDTPLCRRCGAEEEDSALVVCAYESLATLRQTYFRYFSWTQRIL